MTISTINPTTGAVEREFAAHTPGEIEAILERSQVANRDAAGHEIRTTRRLDASSGRPARRRPRGGSSPRLAGDGQDDRHCEVRGDEVGERLRWYADHAAGYLAAEAPVAASSVGASAADLVYQLIGTILAIMPWNYPFWQVIRFAAPR